MQKLSNYLGGFILSFLAFGFLCLVGVAAYSSEPPAVSRERHTCPSGYEVSGNYCLPKAKAPAAVKKTEQSAVCPKGHVTNGRYCVRRG